MSKEVIIDIENPKDNDLISRRAVKEVFPRWKFISYEVYLCAALEIDKLPSVSTEKTGHWIDADGDNAICGCCNRLNHLYGAYCKHCGAKMFEPQESEKINCKATKCENCINHNYCDYEPQESEEI